MFGNVSISCCCPRVCHFKRLYISHERLSLSHCLSLCITRCFWLFIVLIISAAGNSSVCTQNNTHSFFTRRSNYTRSACNNLLPLAHCRHSLKRTLARLQPLTLTVSWKLFVFLSWCSVSASQSAQPERIISNANTLRPLDSCWRAAQRNGFAVGYISVASTPTRWAYLPFTDWINCCLWLTTVLVATCQPLLFAISSTSVFLLFF